LIALLIKAVAAVGHVSLCPEHEVHRLAGPIYRPVQRNPLATNLQIGLVNGVIVLFVQNLAVCFEITIKINDLL
jgi:hypothetical protein